MPFASYLFTYWNPMMAQLFLALLHYPVLNRKGDTIASAITNLDLHDLARSCRYVRRAGVLYRDPAQGPAGPCKPDHGPLDRGHRRRNPPGKARGSQAFESGGKLLFGRCRIITRRSGQTPFLWATTAKNGEIAIPHRGARRWLESESRPFLLLFGTGWGLAPEIFDTVDAVLEPIPGVNGYNHLPVRAAASIMLDRLLGRS